MKVKNTNYDTNSLYNDSSADESTTNDREWKRDENNFSLINGYTLCVGITTRDESLPVYDTPCKMYSSLRYKLNYKCTIHNETVQQLPSLLMARVTVVDDKTGKEIKKDKKPIVDDSLISLKNTTNTNSTNESSNYYTVFEANHKIKFKSVSFHHNKSKWRLMVQLFSDCHDSINTPIYVIQSAPFHVYARRPKVSERDATDSLLKTSEKSSTPHDEKKTKKRKRTETPKKMKKENKKQKQMDQFKKTLDLLIKYQSEMDEEGKRTATELLNKKLYSDILMPALQEEAAAFQNQQLFDTWQTGPTTTLDSSENDASNSTSTTSSTTTSTNNTNQAVQDMLQVDQAQQASSLPQQHHFSSCHHDEVLNEEAFNQHLSTLFTYSNQDELQFAMNNADNESVSSLSSYEQENTNNKMSTTPQHHEKNEHFDFDALLTNDEEYTHDNFL